MRKLKQFAPFLILTALGGCVGLGTNIEGKFTCRAPKGGCAPSQVIDAGATTEMTTAAASPGRVARQTAMVEPGDRARTAERLLRITFPAHVDTSGILHDEAVAWAVIEKPQWSAAMRRGPADDHSPMARLKSQLRESQSAGGAPPETQVDGLRQEVDAVSDADGQAPAPSSNAVSDPLPDTSPFSLASPPALPSTAREAIAGAHAPAVEGFDMPPPPHDRTPRPEGSAQTLTYPSAAAIEAAKAANAGERGKDLPPKEPR
jgi:conjugal transfer pilus assembly protein TraV